MAGSISVRQAEILFARIVNTVAPSVSIRGNQSAAGSSAVSLLTTSVDVVSSLSSANAGVLGLAQSREAIFTPLGAALNAREALSEIAEQLRDIATAINIAGVSDEAGREAQQDRIDELNREIAVSIGAASFEGNNLLTDGSIRDYLGTLSRFGVQLDPQRDLIDGFGLNARDRSNPFDDSFLARLERVLVTGSDDLIAASGESIDFLINAVENAQQFAANTVRSLQRAELLFISTAGISVGDDEDATVNPNLTEITADSTAAEVQLQLAQLLINIVSGDPSRFADLFDAYDEVGDLLEAEEAAEAEEAERLDELTAALNTISEAADEPEET